MARATMIQSRGDELKASRAHPRAGVGIWRWGWLAVLFWLTIVFVLVNFHLPRALPAGVAIYLAVPATWISLALLAYLGWRFGQRERPAFNRALVFMAALTGAFQVAAFALAGLLLGFGHSPYSHHFPALLGNLFYAASTLVGMEMGRAYLLAAFGRRRPTLTLILAALLFSFVGLPFARFGAVNDMPSLFHITGESLLPTLSENVLASFLAFLGGPWASIAYRGTLQAFEWLSPILPRLPWAVTAFLGTMVPALGMLLIRNQFLSEGEGTRAGSGGASTAWVFVGVVAITMLWFNAGLFGVHPTLVSGVSMEPALQAGDVVITSDVPAESIVVGDVVRFRQGGSYILHRVIQIEHLEDDLTFITKGDANNTVDAPVLGGELEGKVVFTVPKIGWLGIGVRKLIEWIR